LIFIVLNILNKFEKLVSGIYHSNIFEKLVDHKFSLLISLYIINTIKGSIDNIYNIHNKINLFQFKYILHLIIKYNNNIIDKIIVIWIKRRYEIIIKKEKIFKIKYLKLIFLFSINFIKEYKNRGIDQYTCK